MALKSGPNMGILTYGLPGEAHYLELMRQWRAIDFWLNPSVKTMATTAPPGSPADGDAYIIPAGATGAWAGKTNQIARWTTDLVTPAWEYFTPKAGWGSVYNQADSGNYIYSGSAWAAAGGGSTVVADNGLFQYVSATQCILKQDGGDSIWINGTNRQISSSGVTISNASLAANTNYYAYASWNGTAVVLELSTTAYTKATNGVPQKTGDATRTLVGGLRTNASSQFTYAADARNVRSWFRRQNEMGWSRPGGSPTGTSSATPSEASTTWRVGFFIWADEKAQIFVTGAMTNSTGQAILNVYLDGITDIGITGASGSGLMPVTTLAPYFSVTEGYHYTTIQQSAQSGTTAMFNMGTMVNIQRA